VRQALDELERRLAALLGGTAMWATIPPTRTIDIDVH
jgi:hypothetical protein